MTVTFRHTFADDGLHLGRVSMRSDDSLAEDDVRYFSLRTARAVPVLLAGADGRTTRYLNAALAPAGASVGTFAVRRGEPRELATASTERESVIILADVERLNEDEMAGLKRFLSDGGGLLVIPGPRTDATAWGRSFFPRFLPGRLTELRTLENGFTISRFDATHPLFGIFRETEGALAEVRFTRALGLRPQAGTSVLASYSTDEPAILESTLLPGRVLYFTSSLDPAWSDMPLTGVFLPLLHECVRYLSETRAKAAEELTVGTGATLWLASVPEGTGVVLRSPDGETRAAAIAPGPGGYAVELPRAGTPGVWTFESQRGDTLAALAANIGAAESDPERVAAADIQTALTGGRSVVLEDGEGIGRALREARVGREIGSWFLWAAALFLLAEMFLAANRSREVGGAA
ncbi:MAG: hypothetical protein HKN12_02140 [Gemmatimonadetes bacterium]|nr:hypothetical protein [Gemmatimonadota bacterium]